VPEVKPLPLPFTTKVVGISQYQDVAAMVEVGDLLDVEREPSNPYDANACKISWKGLTLGYLPKQLASRLVQRDETCWVGSVSVKHSGKATIGVEVLVHAVAIQQDADTPSGEALVNVSKPVPTTVRVVRAKRSGRVLGELIRVERSERRVVVCVGSGEVSYPDGLVEICDSIRH
jgi:hypothetical protein